MHLTIKLYSSRILRSTILFSIYRNVKAPRLNSYLMDIPKGTDYPFHLHYVRYCPKVTDYKTFGKETVMPKSIEQFLAFFENHEIMAFMKFHIFTKNQLEFDFSVKVSLNCIVTNVVCVKFIFANDGHV